jgi:O-antigen ligase
MSSATLHVTQPLHERVLPARAPAWLSCTLLFLLLIVPSYDFRPPSEEGFGIDFQLLVRLGLCGACGLYGLTYWRRSYVYLLNFPGAWAIVFCFWSAATIPAAVSPTYAAVAWIALCCVTLFAPALLAQLNERQILLTIFFSTVTFIAIAWTLYYLVPSIGRSAYMVGGQIEYRVGGDAQQLGFQGVWLIATTLALVNAKFFRFSFATLPIATGLTTIAFAQSRTSFITAIGIICLAILMKAPKTRVLILGMGGGMLTTLLLFGFACGLFSVRGTDVLTAASRSGTQEEIYNVTGRTEFWPYVFTQVGKSPLWGHGFGSSRQALYEFNGHSYHIGELHHAHNTFLNVMLTTGFVGMVILAAMFLGLLNSVLRYRQLFPALVLAVVTVAGLTESLLFGPMPRTHTILWLMALYWQQRYAAWPAKEVVP